MTEPKMLIEQLRICSACAQSSPNESTYLNSAAKVMLAEAADEIERLRAVLEKIADCVGFETDSAPGLAREALYQQERTEK